MGYARKLVVKRILPELACDDEFVRMFVEEARLSASLNHRNIVQVYEFGEVGGEYYLAMEWVHGRDLELRSCGRSRSATRRRPSSWRRTWRAKSAARSRYAHALTDEDGQPMRLIHRDVSPSNVMVGFDGSVKLLDFGIAKALALASENRTQVGVLKGKFGYMAPEQVDIDARGRSSRRPVRRRRGAVGDADAAPPVQGRQRPADDRRWCARRACCRRRRTIRRCRRSSRRSACARWRAIATIASPTAARWRRRSTRSCIAEVRRRRRGASVAASFPERARADGADVDARWRRERTPSHRAETPTPAGERVRVSDVPLAADVTMQRADGDRDLAVGADAAAPHRGASWRRRR